MDNPLLGGTPQTPVTPQSQNPYEAVMGGAALDPSQALRPSIQDDPQYQANQSVIQQYQATLAEQKAAQLANIREEKKAKLNPGQSIGDIINGEDKQDGLLRLFGSSAGRAVGELADLGGELAGFTVGKAIDGILGTHTEKNMSTFFDPATDAKAWDSLMGYDRSTYQETQQKASKALDEGRYSDAFTSAASIAPDFIAESLPVVFATFYGGPLKAVKAAKEVAMSKAVASGMSKTAVKAAGERAEAIAVQDMKGYQKLENVISKNKGLLAVAGSETNKQADQYAKNNNGEGMSSLHMAGAFALNVLSLGLDRWAFKDIIKIKKDGGAIAHTLKKLSPSGVKAAALKIGGIAAAMPKEAAQEYVQTWVEIFNQNAGAANSKLFSDESFKKTRDAALFGAVSGGAMATPARALGASKDLYSANVRRRADRQAKENVAAGFTDQKTRDAFVAKQQGYSQSADDSIATLTDYERKFNQAVQEKANKDAEAEGYPPEVLAMLIGKDVADEDTIQGVSDSKGTLDTYRHFGNIETANTLGKVLEHLKLSKENADKLIKSYTESPSKIDFIKELVDAYGMTDTGIYDEMITDLSKQAKEFLKSEDSTLDFGDAKEQIRISGSRAKKVANRAQKTNNVSGEIDVHGKAANIVPKGRIRSIAKVATDYLKRISVGADMSDLEVDLGKHDTADLDVLKKRATAIRSKLRSTDTSGIFRSNPEIRKYDTLLNAISNVQSNRKALNKEGTVTDRLKSTFKDVKAKVESKLEKIKSNDDTNTNPTSKEGNDEELKKLEDAVAETVAEGTITKEDVPFLQEALDFLKEQGKSSKEFIDKHFASVAEAADGIALEDLDLRAGFKSRLNKISKAITTSTRDDISKEIGKVVHFTSTRATEGEKEAAKYLLGKAKAAGRLTEEKFKEYADKLGLSKPTKEGAKDFFKAGVDTVFTTEGRTKAQETIKSKAKEVKNSKLGKELIKDGKTIASNVKKWFIAGTSTVKENYDKLRTDFDSYDTYIASKDAIKGLFKDGNKVKVEKELLDENGNPLIGDC